MRPLLLFHVLLFCHAFTIAQDGTTASVDLAEGIRISCSASGQVMVEHHGDLGLERRDRFLLEEMDPGTLRISADGGRLLFDCRPDARHCVQSVHFSMDMDRRSSTLTLCAPQAVAFTKETLDEVRSILVPGDLVNADRP